MKKFALLLFALPFVLLSACGDDDKDELEYLDPAIVEGTWLWEDGAYLHYSVYKNNTCKEFIIEKYTKDTIGDIRFYPKYQITKDRIYRTQSNGTTSYIEYFFKDSNVLYMKNVDHKKVSPLDSLD